MSGYASGWLVLPVCILVSLLSACDVSVPEGQQHRAITLTVWLHESEPAVIRALQTQVARFNASQYKIRVNAVVLPGKHYDARIQEAARNQKLPDMIEVASYQLARYVWQGHIIPIDKQLTDQSRDAILPAVLDQGRYQGRIYGLVTHEDETVLFARRSLFAAKGIAIPDMSESVWGVDDFTQILLRIRGGAGDGGAGAAIELPVDRPGYWLMQALRPAIASAGGALTDPDDPGVLQGHLNSAGTVRAMRHLQSWVKQGLMDIQDGNAFMQGRVPLLWSTSQDYGRLKARFDQDLLVLPLPDFGHGPRTSLSAWAWTLTSQTQQRQAAMTFLEFLFEDDRLLAIARSHADMPATRGALSRSLLYRPGGELHMMANLLRTGSIAIPSTPAYPLIARRMGTAVHQILRDQRDVASVLDETAMDLERKIKGFQRPMPVRMPNK